MISISYHAEKRGKGARHIMSQGIGADAASGPKSGGNRRLIVTEKDYIAVLAREDAEAAAPPVG